MRINVDASFLCLVANFLHYSLGSVPFKYLGLPIEFIFAPFTFPQFTPFQVMDVWHVKKIKSMAVIKWLGKINSFNEEKEIRALYYQTLLLPFSDNFPPSSPIIIEATSPSHRLRRHLSLSLSPLHLSLGLRQHCERTPPSRYQH